MKIGIRAGHNFKSTGSNGFINEVEENRKVLKALLPLLRAKYNVIDLTPSDVDFINDLVLPVSEANRQGVDLFISLHFNAYSDGLANGTECYVYSKSDKFKDEIIAQSIVNNISSIGFRNRGVKESQSLYDLKATSMMAIIVEICFVTNSEDCKIYKSNFDKIVKAIYDGIDKNLTKQDTVKPSSPVEYIMKEENRRGTFRCLEKIYFRNAIGINNSNAIIDSYLKGETVNYDKVVDTNKYKYISWIGITGVRRYMPVEDKINNEVWGIL